MKIHRAALESIRAHGSEGFPYEICGLLIGKPSENLVTEVRRVRNLEQQNPEVRYLIDDKEDMRIRKELYRTDLDVLGYYHSHPNHPARPSVFDTERSWESYLSNRWRSSERPPGFGAALSGVASAILWAWRARLSRSSDDPM